LAVLIAGCGAVITNFISRYWSGQAGSGTHRLMYAGISLFLIAQSCAYYLGFIFIDYFAFKNIGRSKKLITAAVIFLAAFVISIIVNIFMGFYFTVSPDNRYIQGNLHSLRMMLTYGSILLIIIDILLSSKYFKHSQSYLIILFVVIVGMGAGLDIVLGGGNLAWPCFAAAVLYLYLFIMHSDSKIDGLTGIGNRASFNEFIDKLSRQNAKTEYSIVMIDLDRFKEINDTLGHLEGDNALCDIAAIIKGCIRYSDFAARYGGDEFVIATEAENDIQRIMVRIQDGIDEQNEKRERPYQLYISYGYDVYTTKSGESVYAFLAKIDTLMYAQKARRKRRGIPSSITANIPVKEGSNV
jgi:diguanylate cyclase (GGDEF)-like protein